MKNLALFFLFFCVVSCNPSSKYKPDGSLSKEQQEEFKYEIIRFAGKLAKRATHETKFNAEFDELYQKAAKSMNLDKYFVNDKDGYIYFEVSRIAPSNYERYVATGGRLKKDNEGNIVDYEEIYRTWKMSREDLAKKTPTYFEYMINGKDLSEFYTVNIGNTENIEFPDYQSFFNKELRRWELKLPDSVVHYQ